MRIEIKIDDRNALLRLDRFSEFARDRLVGALQRIETRLEGAVKAAQPSRTGTLQSQTGGRVYSDNPKRVAMYVGVRAPNSNDARKAAALEYGSRGAIMVRAHQMRLTHIFGRAISPITVSRSQYTRRPGLPALRFLRSPFAALKTTIEAELQAALDGAARDAPE